MLLQLVSFPIERQLISLCFAPANIILKRIWPLDIDTKCSHCYRRGEQCREKEKADSQSQIKSMESSRTFAFNVG